MTQNFNRIISKDVAEYLVTNFAKKQDYYIVGVYQNPNNNSNFTVYPKTFVVSVPVGTSLKLVKYKTFDILIKVLGTHFIDYYKSWFGWSMDLWTDDQRADYIDKLIYYKSISVSKLEDNIKEPN